MGRREATQRGAERPHGPCLRRFLAAEDGTLMVFGLFILLSMLMAAGLAVDTMRHERERVRMQATLDRAVLAATDLDQRLDPEDVVEGYFAAAGILDELDEVTVTPALNSRTVSADASLDLRTIFLDLVGVDTLRAAVGATAKEVVRDVEISLVLDVSTSMRHHSRLTNMKRAALEFVDVLMPRAVEPDDEAITTISLVPYHKTVNIGPDLMEIYGVERDHWHSNCVLFDEVHFDTTALPPTGPLRQHSHFEPGYRDPDFQPYIGSSPRRVALPLCRRAAPPGAAEETPLQPFATDPVALRRAITNMTMGQGTGIDAGMRWGIALLDPSTRPAIEALRARGRVGPAAAGRPLDHRTPNTLKVAVLMTDGEPNGQIELRAPLRSGPSNVWYDPASNIYSVLVRGHHRRCYPYDGVMPPNCAEPRERDGIRRVAQGLLNDDEAPLWIWVRETGGRIGTYNSHPYSSLRSAATETGRNDWAELNKQLVRLEWPDVFDRFSRPDAVNHLHRWLRDERKLSADEWAILGEPILSTVEWWKTSDRLLRLCAAAKAQGVRIYTIGFELNSWYAPDLLRACATDAKHYFNTNGIGISETFRLIASQIEQLRLTR